MVRYASHGTGITGGSGATSITLGPETSTTPVAGANDTVVGTTTRNYSHFTLPSTSALYVFTGIEVLNGTVVNGDTLCAIESIDANPPVSVTVNILAWSNRTAQSGASAIQRFSRLSSFLVAGGTVCGAYVGTSSATARYGTTTVASENKKKAVTPAVALTDITAWTAVTEEPYIKVYYRAIL